MKRWQKKVTGMLAPPLVWIFLRCLRLTTRVRYSGHEVIREVRRDPGAYLLAFWHSRYAFMPFCYREGEISVLLSQHRDARMLGWIMRRFGIGVIHGSSTRGGVAGMRQMMREARAQRSVGIAPDGPRGPRRIAKPGVIAVAKLTGLPIVPVAFSADRAFRLGSWDRTLVPKFFSRVLFVYDAPIRVPRDADPPAQEELRLRLERTLDRLIAEADRRCGCEPEPPLEAEPTA